MKISLVIPVYNEKENIFPLVEKIKIAMQGMDYEAIIVDDGSMDGTREALLRLVGEDRFRIILFQKNYGQTAAISAGVDNATGDVIVPMDGDLENDPADIALLVKKLDEGFDVVSGWRKDRWKNEFITRKIPSAVANWLVSRVSGLKLHDFGCTLKAYRASIIKNIRLYGDMHRFIPAYAFWNGSRIAEVPVKYRPRQYGQSKYGLNRIGKVLLDLLTLKFLSGYATRPIHLFGAVGFVSIVFGIVSGGLAVYFKLSSVHQKDFIQTPLPVIMAMLVVVGVLLIMMGLLAELIMRTYHESQNKPIYTIKERINFD